MDETRILVADDDDAIALAVLVGIAATVDALQVKPLAILRSE